MLVKPGILLLAAGLALPVFVGGARAQNLLDQELGDKSVPPAPAEKKSPGTADAKPAGPSAPAPAATAPSTPAPGGADIISPEASRKVDDSELINKLTNPDQGKPDTKKVAEQVKSMLDRMHESAQRLKKGDPGDVTQETQRRTILDLDALIQLALQQQQSGGSGQGKPQDGQQRRPSEAQASGMGQGGNTPAANAHLEGQGSTDVAAGEMRNHDPATWGKLPPMDRDAISHGANEEYLSSYRDLIDRYYQSLAELAKTGGSR